MANDNGADDALQRIASLLALQLVKEESGPERVRILTTCGFSNRETATLLGFTESYVRSALSRQRKRTAAAEVAE